MASDLSMPRIGAAPTAAEPGRVRIPGKGPAIAPGSLPTGSVSPGPSLGIDGAGESGKPMPNPTLRLDPGLALVVIEFRDGAGKVRETIPTEAQLEAYRASQRSSSAPVPQPGTAAQAEAPARDRVRPPAAAERGIGTAPDAARDTARPPGMPQPAAEPDGSIAAEPRGMVVAQPRGPADSAVPGLPVKASETGTA